MERQKIEPAARAASAIANASDLSAHAATHDSPVVAHRRAARARFYRYQPRAEGRM